MGEEKRPPSLLNTLIAMFMSPGVYTEEDRLYWGQEYLQLLYRERAEKAAEKKAKQTGVSELQHEGA